MFVFIVLLIIASSIGILFYRKKYTYTAPYAEAIKKENDGCFAEALENYNSALAEVKKYKFHEKMEHQLVQKIKVLKSTIEYESH